MIDDHHPWCNYYTKPKKDCKMCARLYKSYPIVENLLKEYFPKVKIKC